MKTGWKILLLYTIFVIVWGAFVRASGSGDGCGAHWPTCHGDLLIKSASFKTAVEYIHRASSGLYGLLVFFLSAWTFFSNAASKRAKIAAFGVLFFTIAESLIGAKLVLSELVGNNTSSARAIVMCIHLINTLILVASNVAVIFFLEVKAKFKTGIFLKYSLSKWAPVILIFFFTGISGALAALGDTLYPSESLIKGFQMDIDPSSPWIIKVRSFHPMFAFLLTTLIIWFTDPKKVFGTTFIILALFTLIVGLINLVLLAPVWMQLMHLGIVQLLWITAIFYILNHLVQKDGHKNNANA